MLLIFLFSCRKFITKLQTNASGKKSYTNVYISLALNFINLLVFLSEMKKVLIFVASALMFINGTHAAVRDGGVASRAKNGTSGISQQRYEGKEKHMYTVGKGRSILVTFSVDFG